MVKVLRTFDTITMVVLFDVEQVEEVEVWITDDAVVEVVEATRPVASTISVVETLNMT